MTQPVSYEDLINAKRDVDHMADLANSPATSATDRNGVTKETWSGIAARLGSDEVLLPAVQARDDAMATRSGFEDHTYPGVYSLPPTERPNSGTAPQDGDRCTILVSGVPRDHLRSGGEWVASLDAQELAQPTGSTLVGTKASQLNARVRTLQQKLLDECNWLDFNGIDPTGEHDSTSAILSAINQAAAAGRSAIAPGGRFVVDDVWIQSACDVRGAGPSQTVLLAAHPTRNTLTLDSDYVAGQELSVLSGLSFGVAPGVTRESGAFLEITDRARFVHLERIAMRGAMYGLRTAADNVTASRLDIRYTIPDGTAIQFKKGFNCFFDKVFTYQESGLESYAGLQVQSCGDLTVSDSAFIRHRYACLINPSAGQVVSSLRIKSVFFDTSIRHLYVQPSTGGSVVRSGFVDTWFGSSSHPDQGGLIDGGQGLVDGLDFEACHGHLAVGDLMQVVGGARNVRVRAGAYSGSAGVAWKFSTTTDCSVVGARIGDTDGLSGNGVGIYVDGANNGLQLVGNNLRGNISSDLSVALDSAPGAIVTGNVLEVAEIDAATIIGGYVEQNAGLQTEGRGAADVVLDAFGEAMIPHGLMYAPRFASAGIVEYGDNTAAITGITDTHIKVRVHAGDSNVTGPKSIMWEARL